MSEVTTTTCRICLEEIKQELNDDIMLRPKVEFLSDQDVNVTDNPVACNKCKVEIDVAHELHSSSVKEEIKDEFVKEGIKSVYGNCVLFNTDLPSAKFFYYCDQCNYGTNDKKSLTDHVFNHRFKCNRCCYTTPANYLLMNHQQIHFMIRSFNRSFECNECGYQTTSKIKLKFHIKTHRTQFLCSFDAHSNNPLKMHSSNSNQTCLKGQHTNTTSKKRLNKFTHALKCNLCEYSCQFRSTLIRHLSKHSNEQSFRCNKCDYKTNHKHHLNRHKITHSEKNPFKCSLCDYSCRFSGYLKRHLIKHSDERPFSCDKCDYKTKTKHNLEEHTTIHSEEKAFKCNLCDYCCNFAKNLKIHLLKHSDERPFSCDKCDYTTKTKYHLKRHKTKHSEEKTL